VNLENFEYTPLLQPIEDDPVIFTLRPLDFAGRAEITMAQTTGPEATMSLLKSAARFIVGWRGGGKDPVTARGAVRAKMSEVMSGPPMITWEMWLLSIAWELLKRSAPSEEDAKKF
jgi:hypothetical protein